MKYSQQIGIAATIALMLSCFLPLSYIASHQITVTGFSAPGTSFGKPGMLHCILGFALLVFFALPAIWAKRTNVFIAAINLAWSFRNYILLSACQMGDCPEKRAGLYALILFSIIVQVMSFLPRMPVKSAS